MSGKGSFASSAPKPEFAGRLSRCVYRVLDVLIAVASAPFVIAVMMPIAALVLLATGRPVLFSQQRAGMHGKPFVLRKFRTMTDDRDDQGNLLPDEKRISRVGGLLRRTRLDELPEFWNIVKGDMSLIGPRPLLPRTIDALGPDGKLRGMVRPGLTGWAQTSGNARLTNREKIALDLWYIAHRSLRLDMIVLLRTFHLVFFGDRVNQRRLYEAETPTQPGIDTAHEARERSPGE